MTATLGHKTLRQKASETSCWNCKRRDRPERLTQESQEFKCSILARNWTSSLIGNLTLFGCCWRLKWRTFGRSHAWSSILPFLVASQIRGTNFELLPEIKKNNQPRRFERSEGTSWWPSKRALCKKLSEKKQKERICRQNWDLQKDN